MAKQKQNLNSPQFKLKWNNSDLEVTVDNPPTTGKKKAKKIKQVEIEEKIPDDKDYLVERALQKESTQDNTEETLDGNDVLNNSPLPV